MPKQWHSLHVCVPYDWHIKGGKSVDVIAYICNKLGVKAGGLVIGKYYLRGDEHWTECLVYCDKMADAKTLKRWTQEFVGHHRKAKPRLKRPA